MDPNLIMNALGAQPNPGQDQMLMRLLAQIQGGMWPPGMGAGAPMGMQPSMGMRPPGVGLPGAGLPPQANAYGAQPGFMPPPQNRMLPNGNPFPGQGGGAPMPPAGPPMAPPAGRALAPGQMRRNPLEYI